MLAAVALAAVSQTGAAWTSGDGPMDRNWNPQYVWTGDFNGDGRTDFVALQEADPGYGQRRYVMFLAGGPGGWTATDGPMPRNWNPQYVWTGDFNGDGRTDLVSLQDADPGYGTRRYVIFFSDGAGGFSGTDGPMGQSWNPRYAWTGDFNGDGRTDLASLQEANHDFGQRNTVSFYSTGGGWISYVSLQCGAGGVCTQVSHMPRSWNPQRVWTGKSNADGMTDLLSLQEGDSGYGQRRFVTFFSTGTVGIRAWTGVDGPMDRNWNPQYVWTGDFDGDGTTDLIGLQDADPGYGQKRFVSFLANGGGGWIPGDGLAPRNWNPQYVWIGDVDGDGRSDIVSLQDADPGYGQKRLVTFLATGASYDGPMPRYWNPRYVWTGDFNGDGKMDLLSLQDGDPGFGQKRYVIFFGE
jgi:hypothetical protein